MLQHEPMPAEQPSSAAQHRVTPEELAQALAAIEARGEERAKTIAISEAVDQLNLRATPDEIWAEVQAQRQARDTARAKRLPGRTRRAVWVGASVLMASLLGWGIYTDRSAPLPDTRPVADAPASLAPTAPVGQNVSVTQDTPSGPLVELLSEVPEGKVFRCKYDDASRIVPGHLARNGFYGMTVVDGAVPDVSWALIKHGADVYLRGWTKGRISNGAVDTSEFDVYSSRAAAGRASIPITLRLGGFDSKVSKASYYIEYVGDYEAITVSHVRRDKHLWEKW